MTRSTLKEEALAGAGQMAAYLNEKIQGGQPAGASAGAETTSPAGQGKPEAKSGGCPFSAMVAQMGLASSGSQAGPSSATSGFTWTPDAKDKLERLPSFVRPMVQSSVEAYARKHGYKTITLQVMDDSKNDSNGVSWTPEAEKRLENIPDFIRPMAKREIERLAKEQGASTITAQVMDEAKEKFMKFM
jgi:hypothetical protein